jgi:hypothetical protein
VTCSRTENADLFAHAMGGYGLFGIILDLDVEMTPNLLLVPTAEKMPAEEFARRFIAAVSRDPSVKTDAQSLFRGGAADGLPPATFAARAASCCAT